MAKETAMTTAWTTSTTPHRIDVHRHVLPGYWLEAVTRGGAKDAGGVAFPAMSIEDSLAQMDRLGIAAAINSISEPMIQVADRDEARSLARRCNEDLARVVRTHPARFGAFAVLPMPDVDASLGELAYAYDTLHVDGVSLLTSYDDRYLGHPSFEPLWAELDRRRAVVFLHPTVAKASRALEMQVPGAVAEFVFDTTRTALDLIYSGSLERYPNVSIILPHAGGTIPYLAFRFDIAQRLGPQALEKAPLGLIASLKRFYYETAVSASRHSLGALRELVAPSQILFGSDYPYLTEPMIEDEIRGLADYPFDAASRAAMDRGNALALFPRLCALLEPEAAPVAAATAPRAVTAVR
jgi:predicted TIM-barrel fold metal-dependent hydrolase